MNKLRDKNRITSLELLEQINIFRKKESDKNFIKGKFGRNYPTIKNNGRR